MPHTLRTERMLLRQISMRDAPAFWRALNTPDYTKMTGTWSYPFSQEEVRRRIRYTPPENYWFTAVHHNEFSGQGLIFGRDQESVEIGYAISPEKVGQGFATEIARALVRFSFRVLRVNVIRARTSVHNPASERVLIRIGFERVGGRTMAWSAHHQKNTPCHDYLRVREGVPE